MEQHTKRWPAVTIRVFALFNLLFGLLGFAALLSTVLNILRYDPWSQDPPHDAQVFYARSAINLVFVMLTLAGGAQLWRLTRRGWTICKILFFGEILYLFLERIDFPSIGKALGASAGTGNMGTVFQTLTGYPIIALIGLETAYSKLHRPPAQSEAVDDLGPPSGRPQVDASQHEIVP